MPRLYRLVLLTLTLLVGGHSNQAQPGPAYLPVQPVGRGAALQPDSSGPRLSFTVNNFADAVDSNTGDGTCNIGDGSCTLRAAVMQAAASGAGTHSILIPAGAIIVLSLGSQNNPNPSSGDLDVTFSLVIGMAGSGAAPIISNTVDRIFEVHDGGSLTASDLWLWKSGVLTSSGGAIAVNGGSFEGTNLQVLHNTGYAGGGIYVNNSPAFVLRSSFVGLNSATTEGGGIASYFSSGEIVNSTIAGNQLSTDYENGYTGAGLYVSGTSAPPTNLRVIHSTIVRNFSSQYGGGVSTFGSNSLAPIVTLTDSILAHNTALIDASDCMSFSPTNVSISFTGLNTVRETAASANGCFNAGVPAAVLVSDAGFAALPNPFAARTLGQMLYIAPLADNPAIGALGGCAPEALGQDVVHAARPQGMLCDIGAYESPAGSSASLSIEPDPLIPGGVATITLTDLDRVGEGTLEVEVTTRGTASPDHETVTLTETGSGVFSAVVDVSAGAAIPNDTLLQAGYGHTVHVWTVDLLNSEARLAELNASAVVQAASAELLTNGGFESGITGWVFNGSVNDGVTKKNPYDGTKAFRFVGSAGKTLSKLKQKLLSPAAGAGDRLDFTAQITAKGAIAHKISIKLNFSGGLQTKLKLSVVSGAYSEYALSYELPAAPTLIELSFNDQSQSGKVTVDVVSLRVTAADSPRVMAGWSRGTTGGSLLPPPPSDTGGFRGVN